MTGEETWEQVISDNELTEETISMFEVNLLYSCILLLMVSCIGCIGFTRKELK